MTDASHPSPEPDAAPEADAWDSPAQREYEADPAAYDARVAARSAELQAAEAAADRAWQIAEAETEAQFWEMREAEQRAEAEAEIG